MEISKTRIELPDGGWAVLYTKVLRRTHRLHTNLLMDYLVPVEPPKPQLLSKLQDKMKFGEAPKPPDYTIDTTKIDNNKVNELFIFNQVVEWSFGPVNYDTLETGVNREQYVALIKEMDRLYEPNPLSRDRNGSDSVMLPQSPSSNNSRSPSSFRKLITSLSRKFLSALKS
jgi:hypothetical protein